VITVPAYFDDAARSATKQAAKLAGLEVLRLINEPTAAALAYGLDSELEGVYIVYDLGGGTFDVSILDMQKGIFKVLATGGDTRLGGDDFDAAISGYLIDNYIGIEQSLDVDDRYKLLEFASEIKEVLSSQEQYNGKLSLCGKNYEVSYSKADFEQLIKPFIERSFVILDGVIRDSKKQLGEIKEIILVGGSTKIPYVQTRLTEYFAQTPLCTINPEQVVALGAALQAEALTKGTNNLLVDVVPLSLGIETMGGMVEKIIERNTPVPAYAFQEFTTYEDNQTGIIIQILQGERELVSQNRSLATFVLNGLPRMPAGKLRIKIDFKIDRDGILTVSACEASSNVVQEIQVKPSFGLAETEIMQLLRESMDNAKSDMKARLVAKYKFEIADQVKSILHLVENEIEFFSKEQIRNAKEFAKKRLSFIEKGPEFDKLQEYHAGTKQYLDDLAIAKVKSITMSLKGKNIAELNEFFKEKGNKG
jgi:molecular chaperone HscA